MIESVQTELVKVQVDAYQTCMTPEETNQLLIFLISFSRANFIDFRLVGLILIVLKVSRMRGGILGV